MSTLFPGGAMARRALHFIWILDCSGSMTGRKIQSLNTAIQEAIPQMREAAAGNPGVDVLVRVVTFSKGADWHLETPTPLSAFEWENVSAGGHTDMGAALTLVSKAMQALPSHGVPPVLVLVTDGQPTDDFDEGLKLLLAQKWGERATRISIAIGGDADLHVLQRPRWQIFLAFHSCHRQAPYHHF